MTSKTGPELMDEMVEEPTLDHYYDRDPNGMTEEDFEDFIAGLRKSRAIYIAKKKAKKEKQ